MSSCHMSFAKLFYKIVALFVGSEGRHPRVLGPVFLQLKVALAPFWTRPQHLSYLAWARVRTAIGPKRLARCRSTTLIIL